MTNEGINKAHTAIVKLVRIMGELSPTVVLAVCKDLGLAHDDTHAAIWHASAAGDITFTQDWRIKAVPSNEQHVHQPDGTDAGAHPDDPYFCECGAEIVRGWVVK